MKRLLTSLSILLLLSSQAFAESQTLSVDTAKSYVGWLGKKVTGQHNGKVLLKKGEVILEDGSLSGGSFSIDMSSIENEDIEGDTWKKKLENHLKSDDFFNVSSFPLSTFTITSVKKKSADSYDVTGSLTVKGIGLPITFPVSVSKQGDSYVGEGKVTIDRSKWDIRYNSGKFFDPQQLGDKLIYDGIDISLYIVAG